MAQHRLRRTWNRAMGIRTTPSTSSNTGNAAGPSARASRTTPQVSQPATTTQAHAVQAQRNAWSCSDFMLGSGMVIIQPSSGKVVLLYERRKKHWFLPKGRKDVGESLEQTALREAYEESGYRVEFLPVFMPHNAPAPPGSAHRRQDLPCTEPFYVTSMSWTDRDPTQNLESHGDYFTFWYIGQIPADAVPEANTGMPDEQNYETHLMDIGEAIRVLRESHASFIEHLVIEACTLWVHTVRWLAQEAEGGDGSDTALAEEHTSAVGTGESSSNASHMHHGV